MRLVVNIAFITSIGQYQFTRVPFGLKTAPSYFQEKMASDVLRGLLYFICEVYIDDIIIGGDSEEDLAKNLRLVFTRLVEENVKLNPKKLKIGLTEIKYVGHILSAEGVNMTGEKILKVDFV